MATDYLRQVYTLDQAEDDIGGLIGLVDKLQEIHEMPYDLAGAPNTPVTGHTRYSQGGYPQAISATDANPYDMAHLCVFSSSTTPISSTTNTNINNLSVPVAAGQVYRIHAQLVIANGTGTTGTVICNLNCSGGFGFNFATGGTTYTQVAAVWGPNAQMYHFTQAANNNNYQITTAIMGTGSAPYDLIIDGMFKSTTASNLIVQCAEGVSGVSFTTQIASYLKIEPVVAV